MANARVQLPAEVKHGEAFEIRLLIRHPMETGFRHDEVGHPIPQNVVNQVTCRYNGSEVFRAELFPGIAANPYLAFFTVADSSGELEVNWTDDTGATESERVSVTVKE
jgi:sulfur-oxidizing protein SoxZ